MLIPLTRIRVDAANPDIAGNRDYIHKYETPELVSAAHIVRVAATREKTVAVTRIALSDGSKIDVSESADLVCRLVNDALRPTAPTSPAS